jgi:hypothetical protein
LIDQSTYTQPRFYFSLALPLLVFLYVQFSVQFFTVIARGTAVHNQPMGIYWTAVAERPVALYLLVIELISVVTVVVTALIILLIIIIII